MTSLNSSKLLQRFSMRLIFYIHADAVAVNGVSAMYGRWFTTMTYTVAHGAVLAANAV